MLGLDHICPKRLRIVCLLLIVPLLYIGSYCYTRKYLFEHKYKGEGQPSGGITYDIAFVKSNKFGAARYYGFYPLIWLDANLLGTTFIIFNIHLPKCKGEPVIVETEELP